MKKLLMIKCCSCKEKFSYYDSEYRPFCSEKCKMIDLGQWFQEAYSIEGRTNSVYIEDEEKLQTLIENTNENY